MSPPVKSMPKFNPRVARKNKLAAIMRALIPRLTRRISINRI
ncbi:MAG: hypothetical protein BWY88_01033 [Synergistetes bacterium ADurb.Bin520]|nr:MAG: hypothetical protein BWY88_01033 [Synergistetes bacterium ADurb.Bin520]